MTRSSSKLRLTRDEGESILNSAKKAAAESLSDVDTDDEQQPSHHHHHHDHHHHRRDAAATTSSASSSYGLPTTLDVRFAIGKCVSSSSSSFRVIRMCSARRDLLRRVDVVAAAASHRLSPARRLGNTDAT